MKRAYKCTDARLVDYFENSRDKWKERSNKYQKEKKMMQLEIRDLRRSKEKWKTEYHKLKAELNELHQKQKKTKELLQLLINI